jgi:hypothetical protein
MIPKFLFLMSTKKIPRLVFGRASPILGPVPRLPISPAPLRVSAERKLQIFENKMVDWMESLA